MVTTRLRHGGAILLVAAAIASACAGPGETGGEGTSASSPGRRTPASATEAAALDLQAMLTPVPEYEGMGRNLFAFGPARRSADGASDLEAPPAVEPAPRPIVTAPPRLASRPGPSAAARLDMKYAGFLEKTGAGGVKEKYAIFLDGNEILAGAEGELLANRFTVVEIGLESVTVSPSGSSATQRIPLQSK
jgi:hypothetical protein